MRALPSRWGWDMVCACTLPSGLRIGPKSLTGTCCPEGSASSTPPSWPPHPARSPPYLAILLTPRLSFHLSPSLTWAFPRCASSCRCPTRKRGEVIPGGRGERKEIIRKRWDQHQAHDPQLPLPCPGGDTRLGTPHSEDVASCTSSFPQLLGWMLTRIYFYWVPC